MTRCSWSGSVSRFDKLSRIRVPDSSRARRTIQIPVSLVQATNTGVSLSDAPRLSSGLRRGSRPPESGIGKFAGRSRPLLSTGAQSPQHTSSLFRTRGSRAFALTG